MAMYNWKKLKTKKGYVQLEKIKIKKNGYVQLQMKVFQFHT